MKISIVIPNYNGEDLLRNNLSYVLKATENYQKKSKNETEIIIVDDCSIDNSVMEIKNQKSKIKNNIELKIVQNQKNLGFSSSVNKGVQETDGDIIVLLNTDVRPQEDFFSPLIEHFDDQELFAVGCMDKSIENDRVVLRGRGIGRWHRGFLIHEKGEVNKNSTLWVNGGSGAFRKIIWNKLGGFNPLYAPFYWEDIDISYRALKLGYKTIFEPKSIVIHEHEKGAIKQKYSSFQIKTIAYKNQFIFVWINITDFNLRLQHIVWLPYHFLIALKNMDWAFFIGFFRAFILFPKILQYYFTVHKFFIRKDKDILFRYLS